MGNDSCRLIAVNMLNAVDDPYTDDASFNFERWYESVYEAQVLLDNLVDLELEGVQKIIDKVRSDDEPDYIKDTEIRTWQNLYNSGKRYRRTGNGFTGKGDTVAALGLKYDDALEMDERIARTKLQAEFDASIDMAITRGRFEDFDMETEDKSEFIQMLQVEFPDIYDRMSKYGRRNVSISTIAPTGCSRGDSLLLSSEGLIQLDELIEEEGKGFYPLDNLFIKQEAGDAQASKKYVNGEAETKIITLKSGLELESTLTHRYRILENDEYIWKTVADLQIGDVMVNRIGGYDKSSESHMETVEWYNYKNTTKPINQPITMNPDLAKLLGIMYADGSVHIHPDKYINSIRIHMNPNDTELIEDIVKLVESQFGFTPQVHLERTCISIYITSKYLMEYLIKNNCLKQKSYEVEIPYKVRTSSKEALAAFVHGYWLADGSQTGNTRYIDTVSKKMAQQLMVVFRALGENSRIHTYTDREKALGSRPLHRVYFVGYGSLEFDKYRYIRRTTRELLDKVRVFGDNLCFDIVDELEDSSTFTYDIEVPENNTYILNGMVSHNSLSMLAKNGESFGVSGGIEPVFALWFTRRKKINPNENVEVDFVDDLGDKWQEFNVYHAGFREWGRVNGLTDLEQNIALSPYYKATAPEIDWEKRIKIQAIYQKYTTHSISSTLNLPETVTIDDVSDIYLNAWKHGLKGITIYRDGSRAGVLITKKEVERDSPKRPKNLPCRIFNTTRLGANWLVLVGYLDGEPYELFAFENDRVKCDGGILKKKGGGVYDLICDDDVTIPDITSTRMTDETEAITRLISLNLREGRKIDHIVNQLSKSNGTIVNFSKVVSRTLRKLADVKITKGKKCPDCQSEMVMIEGCSTCPACGSSSCG